MKETELLSIRKKRGLARCEVAKAVGISDYMLKKIESNTDKAKVYDFYKLINYYRLSKNETEKLLKQI